MHAIKRPVENANKPANKRVVSRPDWSRETCIVTQPNFVILNPSFWKYGGQCRPSTQNIIMVNKHSGKYLKDVCSSKIPHCV